MTTTIPILLFAVLCVLGVGFAAIYGKLVEIRDAVDEWRGEERLRDDDEDEWSVVRGNPPFGAGYGSGKGQPQPFRPPHDE